MMVKAVLKKPLDGQPEGTIVDYTKADFEMLEKLGAVELAPDDTTSDDGKKPADPPAEPKGDAKADLTHANKMAPAAANKATKSAAEKAD